MNPFGDDDDNEDPFGEDPEWALDPTTTNDNDTENSPAKPTLYGAEHALILLDCNPTMFERYIHHHQYDTIQDTLNNNDEGAAPAPSPSTPMELSLTAITQLLRMRIRMVAESKTGKRNGVGVLLFGCDRFRRRRGADDDDNPSDDDEGIITNSMLQSSTTHELVELVPPGIEQVMEVQKYLEDGNNHTLEKEFSIGDRRKENGEEEEDCAHLLKSALHEANKVFMHAKCVKSDTPSNKLPDSKSLWIFTNNDRPCTNEGDIRQIAAIAKDAIENGIDIHLLPLPPKDHEFDKSLFYDQILSPESVEYTQDGEVDVEALLESFDQAIRKVRKYTVLPLLLPGWKDREDDDPGIMVDLYSKIQTKTKPQSVTVHQELNRATNIKRRIIERDTGAEVHPSRLHTYAEFCGGQVTLKKDDIKTMKSLCNSSDKPSLILFGFKKMHTLSTTNLIDKPLLAFGNDELVKGSRKALFNLKQSMLRKDVYAVGELLVRKTFPSRMVALIPQNDSYGGFQIIRLPFKEELRTVSPDDVSVADRNVVDAATAMVSKSVITTDNQFSSILPENPYLSYFFNFLESISLGGKLIKPDDDARMNEDMMLASARREMEEFALSLPEDEVTKTDRKRKQPVGVTNKRNVNVPSGSDEDIIIPREWIEMYRNDEIEDCTANELKEFLRSIGERITGKKGDLVDRIHRTIQKQLLRK